MNESLAEKIYNDIVARIGDDQYLKYLAEYLSPTGLINPISAKFVIDRQREEFLAGKEAEFEDLCQTGNLAACVYAGFDEKNNIMRFWPEDERAQVIFLAGYAALEGHPVDLSTLGAFTY